MQASERTPGLTQALCWSPKQAALTPAQGHWSIQYGIDIHPLDNHERDILANAVTALMGYDFQNDLFWSENVFSQACQRVLSHVGVQDWNTPEERPQDQVFRYFSIDQDLLNSLTIGTVVAPNGIDMNVRQFMDKLGTLSTNPEYRDALNDREDNNVAFEEVDFRRVWWEAGLVVKLQSGHRMPCKRETVMSPLQVYLKWLDRNPAKIPM